MGRGRVGGFTEALKKFGIGRLAAILGVAAGVAAVLVAVMLRMGQAPDALLYSNLDLREAGEITAALDQAGIKYSSKGDGSTIMVNRDEVGTARMMLAGQGLVTSGSVGYELFDNQSVLGQTEFQQQLNEQRALQGELARTIMSMRGITAARVHITMPRREMFTAAAGEPTAAVLVGLGGRDLTADQVRAIRNLVASSVPNLKPDRVTVADQNNRTLAAGDDGGFTSASAAETKGNTEAQLQARIKDIVEGVVGVGSARVQVTADIDQSRSTTQEQKFDPDGQVVRSTTANGSQSSDTTGQNDGGVTAANNIPGGAPPATTPAGSTTAENAETTNYEISNTTTTTTKEPGEVKKLAVAVAVDGKWTPAADGKGEPTYAPRSAEEIAQIKSLVAAAAGIDEARGDKIEVINVRFNRDTGLPGGLDDKPSLLDFSKTDVMRLIELGILAVVALLLIFFVLRPLLKTAGSGGAAGPGAPALAAPDGTPVATLTTTVIGPDGQPQLVQLPAPNEMDQKIDIARIEGQVKASSVKKVADFVQAHPDEAANILRNWVAEG